MNNWKKITGIGTLALVIVVGTLAGLPSAGEESDHQDLTIETVESTILSDNVAIGRSELALELAEEELSEAEDNKSTSGSTSVETAKNRRYYVKEAEMNLYVAEKDLLDTQQSEILDGVEMYYNYLLLVKEISQQNETLLRLKDELAGVNKKIELGSATVTARTTKELEIAKVEFNLLQLNNEKENLFLDMNLALQQDLETVLVIEDVTIPFEVYPEADLESDIEFVLATNKGLWSLEKQDALDEILLDIYEDNNSSDDYDSEIIQMKVTLKQNALDIADKKLSLEYDVRSKYNNLLNAYDTVQIKELELENTQIALNTTSKRFEVGFETENTLKAAQETVEGAELALLQAKLDYYVAVESYKDFIN